MYQTVFRDAGGSEIVRVLSSAHVVNGSLLIVPADTIAFFVCNGHISQPYNPGRWEIHTGVDPFFVRFRNLMTSGDPGITCQIFYVNIYKENCMSGGTGNMIFQEKRFHISMNAKASYVVRYVISEPGIFLRKLVGMHNHTFAEEDIRPAMDSLLLPFIKEGIIGYISNNTIHSLQNSLPAVGNAIREALRHDLNEYGLKLCAVSVTAINVPDEDMRRLNELESRYAEGIMNTDIEVDNINRVYGNVENRTLTEVATGSVRGTANRRSGNGEGNAGMAGLLAALPVQIAVANRVINQMEVPISQMMDRGANGSHSRSGRAAPPDLPQRQKICPDCNRHVDRNDTFCRYCGHQF